MRFCDRATEKYLRACAAFVLQLVQYHSSSPHTDSELTDVMESIDHALRDNITCANLLHIAIKFDIECAGASGKSATVELNQCVNRIAFLMKMFIVARNRYYFLFKLSGLPENLQNKYGLETYFQDIFCSVSAGSGTPKHPFFSIDHFAKLVKSATYIPKEDVDCEAIAIHEGSSKTVRSL
jgi:hypothetical protein